MIRNATAAAPLRLPPRFGPAAGDRIEGPPLRETCPPTVGNRARRAARPGAREPIAHRVSPPVPVGATRSDARGRP